MIAIWFAQKREINENKRINYIKDILQLNYDIKNTLDINNKYIEDIVKKLFHNRDNCFILGKGKSESVAKEGALNNIRSSLYKLNVIDKPIKGMSSYKVAELLDICSKLGIEVVNKETGKNKTKNDLYESIIQYF